MTRLAHPRPEAIALKICGEITPRECLCRKTRSGLPPGQRIKRQLCEDMYQRAIQIIIDRIRALDPVAE